MKSIKILEVTITVIFIGLLLIPLAGYLANNSTLMFNENYFGRYEMIKAVNNFTYKILKDKIYKDFIVDQSGWFVYTGDYSLYDFQNPFPFPQDQLDSIKYKLEGLCSKLNQNGIKFVFVIPPNKNTIYPEYMPKGLPVYNQSSRLDQIISIWTDTEYCKLIDLHDTIYEESKKNQVFYATDTHWNQIGAFLGYQQVSQLLQQWYPTIDTHNLSDFTLVEQEFMGEFTKRNFGQIQVTETALFLQPKTITNSIILNSQDSSGINVTSTSNPNKLLPRALIYHDSFFFPVVEFLADSFAESNWFYTPTIDMKYVMANKPDVVILEVTERLMEFLNKLPNPDG